MYGGMMHSAPVLMITIWSSFPWVRSFIQRHSSYFWKIGFRWRFLFHDSGTGQFRQAVLEVGCLMPTLRTWSFCAVASSQQTCIPFTLRAHAYWLLQAFLPPDAPISKGEESELVAGRMASNVAEMWTAPIWPHRKIYVFTVIQGTSQLFSPFWKQHKRNGPQSDVSQSIVLKKQALESPGSFIK